MAKRTDHGDESSDTPVNAQTESPAVRDLSADESATTDPTEDAAEQRRDEDRHHKDQYVIKALMGDGESSAEMTGQMISAADAAATDGMHSAEQKKEKTREALWEALLDHLEWLDEQIAFWEERISALSRQETALENLLSRIRAGEDPELDETGRLRNRDAEQAIAEYEKRHGVSIDRATLDPATVQLILDSVRNEKDYAARNIKALETERDRVRTLDPDNPAHAEEIEELSQRRDGRIALDAASAAALQEGDAEAVRHADVARGYDEQEMAKNEEALGDWVEELRDEELQVATNPSPVKPPPSPGTV